MALNLMAFAKSQEVHDSVPVEKFMGSTIAHLEFINPTVEQLKTIGINVDKKEYISEVDTVDVNGNKKKGSQNAMEFWYSFEYEGEKKYVAYKIWFSVSAYIGSQSGKIQICDHYGRFAWATPEEYKSGAIPQYSSGPARISHEYRAAVRGEEEVIELMKVHLGMNIPAERMPDGSYRDFSDEQLSARADEFSCFFEPKELLEIAKGNVKVIRDALAGSNDIMLILGVRHAESGDYQIVYDVKKRNFSSFASIENEWNKRPVPNVEILVDNHVINGLTVYKNDVKPTDIKSKDIQKAEDVKSDDLPF